jgi:hypothetical protein
VPTSWVAELPQGVSVTYGTGRVRPALLHRHPQVLAAPDDALVLGLRKVSLGWSTGLEPTPTALLLHGMAQRLPVSCLRLDR